LNPEKASFSEPSLPRTPPQNHHVFTTTGLPKTAKNPEKTLLHHKQFFRLKTPEFRPEIPRRSRTTKPLKPNWYPT
jgi:hypothetical protein